MKRNITLCLVFSFLLLASFNLFATITIQCGDTNKAYVGMDLSPNFVQKHLSDVKVREYNRENLCYQLAGRNCGLGNWNAQPQFEVLFLYECKKFSELLDLGPMSLFPATINIDMDQLTDDFLTNGMILSGEGNNLVSEKGVSATLKHTRGKGSAKVIVELKNY